MTSLDLNVFTNFCANRIDRLPIFGTLRSFGAAFGFDAFANIRVFCHAAPLSVPFDALHAALLRPFLAGPSSCIRRGAWPTATCAASG